MIACVLFPHFAVTLERRDNPKLAGYPLIISQPTHGQLQVFATSSQAAQMGVRPGMRLAEAQALCPDARVIPADQARYQDTLDQLLAVLAEFASQVELEQMQQAAISWLDLTHLARAQAPRLVQEIGRAARQATDLPPAIGLANGKFPAWVAALVTEPNKALLITPGHEAAFLSPFSVTLLPLEAEIARRFKLLGLGTLGQLAALPVGAVLTQFGQQGRWLHQLAQGRDQRPVMPYRRTAREQVERQLDSPVADQTILTTILRSLAETLATRLQAQGRLSRTVRLTLHLEDETSLTRKWVMRQPTATPDQLVQILVDLLGRVPIRCGVSEIVITLTDLSPAMGQQLDLFSHRGGQEDHLRQVLQDLLARYGTCFYQVSLVDVSARLPEQRFRWWKVDTV